MKQILILLIVVTSSSSCMYEYRKLPNTKRVTKREVKKSMEYSTWEGGNYARKNSINNSVDFIYK